MNNYMEELRTAKPIGESLSIFEIEDPHYPDEHHIYYVMKSENFLFVGGMSNTGFLYSRHMELDHDLSLDENLQVLYDILYSELLDK